VVSGAESEGGDHRPPPLDDQPASPAHGCCSRARPVICSDVQLLRCTEVPHLPVRGTRGVLLPRSSSCVACRAQRPTRRNRAARSPGVKAARCVSAAAAAQPKAAPPCRRSAEQASPRRAGAHEVSSPVEGRQRGATQQLHNGAGDAFLAGVSGRPRGGRFAGSPPAAGRSSPRIRSGAPADASLSGASSGRRLGGGDYEPPSTGRFCYASSAHRSPPPDLRPDVAERQTTSLQRSLTRKAAWMRPTWL